MTGGKMTREQKQQMLNRDPERRENERIAMAKFYIICAICNQNICSSYTYATPPPYWFDVDECANLKVENGVAICSNCNKELGKIYGNGSAVLLNNVVQLKEEDEDPER